MVSKSSRGWLLSFACASTLCLPAAHAATKTAKPVRRVGTEERLRRITVTLAAQAEQIRQQEQRLAAQEQQLTAQSAELARLRSQQTLASAAPDQGPASPRPLGGSQLAQNSQPASPLPPPSAPVLAAPAPAPAGPGLPSTPVGQAPEPANVRPVVLASIPQNLGVLTPAHHFVFEPDVEYDRVGSNRLVFQGVEIIPGLQLGLVNANQVADDVVIGTADLRYGVTNRFELELKVPYFYNHDRLTTLAQQVTPGVAGATMTTDLEGDSLGDVELIGRYQVTAAREGRPVWIANLRVKSDTGIGPYDVNFDGSGIATSLPTGSGFWGVEPGMTMLLPLDPVVLFANVGYLHNFSRDINKTLGMTHVGNVTPGDSVDGSFGFAFAVNQRFSYSLGFTNSYIFGTTQQLNATTQRSEDLEVGSLTLGLSYRIRRNLLLSTNLEFGVTPDAPNLQIIFKLPLSF